MSKVITERPRSGHRLPSRKAGGRVAVRDSDDEYEDQPKHLSISWGSQSNWGRKYFSDLLGPLRRYLRGNVGRPWEKVYGEIKSQLDTRTVTGRHVLDHVRRDVKQNCFIAKDGQIYALPMYGAARPVHGLFAHPRTGLLRWKDGGYWTDQKKAQKESQKNANIRKVGDHSYIKVDGIWYFGHFTQWVMLTGYGQPAPAPPGSYEKDGKWFAPVRKKQCSKAELKAAGLSNDGLT
jgi:hypothetical protein